MQVELLKAEARSFFDATSDAVSMMDEAGAIAGWSARAEHLFGWSSAEVCGRLLFDVIIPEELRAEVSRELEGFTRGARPRTGCRRVEVIAVDRRGSRLNLELTLTSTETGAALRVYAFMRDVTEVTRLRLELAHAEKLGTIGRHGAEIAHDLNNALTVISALAGVATEQLRADDPIRTDMLDVLSACEGATRLTRQLLTFARKEESAPRVVDVAATVGRLSTGVRTLLGKEIALETRCQERAGFVRIDPLDLERLVTNLTTNARDAMPNGGTLTIATTNVIFDVVPEKLGAAIRPGRFVEMRVTDTGSGIAAGVKERLFEPFFTTKETEKGTGLGLATVFEIARKNGGHVRVESAPGRGTSFYVYLPAIAENGGPDSLFGLKRPTNRPLSSPP